jgi:hypothetical protein
MSNYFCSKCNRLNKDNVCLVCGNENLPFATDGDFCFLLEVDNFKGKMFKQILDNNGIKYSIMPKRTGVGYGAFSRESDNYAFYVEYKNYRVANDLFAEIFNK